MTELFADVIMPLSVPKLLTYRVPREQFNDVFPGGRVIVQVKRKLYTGIVRRLHSEVPVGYSAFYLVSSLDTEPIVDEVQMQFWDWLSEYYMCSPGDVLNAALPGHLRLSSDTVVVPVDGMEYPENLPPKEEAIYMALQQKGSLSIAEVEKLLNQITVMQHINRLIKKGLVAVKEEIRESYKPKMETYIELSPSVSEASIGEVLDILEKKAPKQVDVLMRYLHLGKPFSEQKSEVSKPKLLKDLEGGDSALKSLEKKGIVVLYEKEIGRFGFSADVQPISELSENQQNALQEIESIFTQKPVVLLKGVTSSGKTEIFIRLIENSFESKNEVLYLLPEIAITAQIISRLQKVFGRKVMVYHSRLSANERVDVWREMIQRRSEGEKVILVGPRSALMLPFRDLGLIIVDEEHDPNFKQMDSPRYHARDAAIWLASKVGAKVILGSATPSVESWHNAKEGKYGLVQLSERFGGAVMPDIQISDIRELTKKKMMKSLFSPMLLDAIKETTESGRQVMLFQNRRGFSSGVECQSCGWIPQCVHCDVSLTYHRGGGQLRCHYCGYATVVPTTCGTCGETQIRTIGFGTEKVEDELAIYFPNLKIGRMDLDTTRSRIAYDRIFTSFSSGEMNVLVGTQMISKGLDFANVGLVGILNADTMLGFPDYRSFERGYQLMVQVSGRAGRRNKPGKVIIQTKNPSHPVIQWVIAQDFDSLIQHEFTERQLYNYPPFARLINFTLRHPDSRKLDDAAAAFAFQLREVFGNRVLGPAYPNIPRIRNQYNVCLMLKIEKNASYSQAKLRIKKVIDAFKASAHRSNYVMVEVDG